MMETIQSLEIIGLPGGLAARHFGFDPVQWQDCAAMRAKALIDLGRLLAASGQPQSGRRTRETGPESA